MVFDIYRSTGFNIRIPVPKTDIIPISEIIGLSMSSCINGGIENISLNIFLNSNGNKKRNDSSMTYYASNILYPTVIKRGMPVGTLYCQMAIYFKKYLVVHK